MTPTVHAPARWLLAVAWASLALLSIVGIAAAFGRAMRPGDLTRLAEPVRNRIFAELGLEDPLLAERPAEFERVDSRFAAHPRATLLHVVPGGLFLLLAPLQFSSRIRTRHVAVHRWSGRLLVALAVASVVPGFFFGLLMPYAGAAEAAVVAVFGGLFVVALGKAVAAIRRGEVARHREWMIRAYAVAIGIATTRVVGAVVDLALSPVGFRPRGLFVLAIAGGWVLTVGAAELWLAYTRPRPVRNAVVLGLAITTTLLGGSDAKAWGQNGFALRVWKGAWGSDGPIHTGDLNGDGRTDVFMWRDGEKDWTVNLSTGSGFVQQGWKGAWGSDGPIHTGDLNGDGKTDVFMWRDGEKDWTVNLSTGGGFVQQGWKGAWGSDGPIHTGDLNGDGKTDVFMWRESEKDWTVNLSTGAGFVQHSWKGAWGSDGPNFVGDLDGDGRTDVFMWRRSRGDWTINLSTGSAWSTRRWLGACADTGPALTGDWNGDQRVDVALWRAATNDWLVNLSTGSGFDIQNWSGAWASDGPAFVGDLDGDGRSDAFFWRPRSNDWTLNLAVPVTLGPPRTKELDMYHVRLGILPDTGDLRPDALVPAHQPVTLIAHGHDDQLCLAPGNVQWKVDFIPRDGLMRDVSDTLFDPGSNPLLPQFAPERGTYRVTLSLKSQPGVMRRLTIESAETDEWVHIGPDGRVNGAVAGENHSGRINSIAFDPNTRGLMYAASSDGGLFRSEDHGTYWYPLSDNKVVGANGDRWKEGLNTGRVVVLPNSHLVVGTGDTDGDGMGRDDPPIYLSSDGGSTWRRAGSGCASAGEPDTPRGTVYELATDPVTGTLYAAIGGSVFRSTSEGNCWRNIDPPSGIRAGLPLLDIALQISPPTRETAHRAHLYAAADARGDTARRRRLSQVLFFTSDAARDSPSWTSALMAPNARSPLNAEAGSSIERIQLAATKDAAYLLAPIRPGDPLWEEKDASRANRYAVLFRAPAPTPVDPPTWTKVTTPPTYCNGQCDDYDLALAANPATVSGLHPGNEVVVAGVNHVVRSTDGGSTWASLGQLHSDHHWLQFDPWDPRTLWDAGDGGLSRASTALFGGWDPRNYGLSTTLAYSGAISGSDPDLVATGVGLQDNGSFMRMARGRVWTRVSCCDGFQARFDAGDATIAYESQLWLGRVINRWSSATNTETGLGQAQFYYADPFHAGRLIGINPGNAPSPTLYQAYVADGAHAATANVDWKCIDPQPTLADEYVTSVLFLRGDPSRYYFGNKAGEVWRSDHSKIVGNATCGSDDTAGDPIYTTEPTPDTPVVDMANDPADPLSFYLLHERGDEWRVVHLVHDAAADAWNPQPLAQNLPSHLNVKSVGVDPRSPSTIYVGTDSGLFRGSSTPSADWVRVSSFPDAKVVSISTALGDVCDSRGVLRAATFGRSTWERVFPSGRLLPGCAQARARSWLAFFVGPDGTMGPTDQAMLQVERSDGTAPALGEIRVELLDRGRPIPSFRVEPVGEAHGRGLFHVAAGDIRGLLATDAVRISRVAADGAPRDQESIPLSMSWRGSKSRVLSIGATLSATEGGASFLRGLKVRLGDRVVETPASIELPVGTIVSILAPSSARDAHGRRGAFSSGTGSLRVMPEWEARAPIDADHLARAFRFPLDGDASIELKYVGATMERERATSPHRSSRARTRPRRSRGPRSSTSRPRPREG